MHSWDKKIKRKNQSESSYIGSPNRVYSRHLKDKISHVLHNKVQTKLNIASSNDVYEKEADKVAEKVLNMSVTSGPQSTLYSNDSNKQKKLDSSGLTGVNQSANEQSSNPLIQTKTYSPTGIKDHSISTQSESNVNRLGGSGKPLAPAVRSFFEPRFGYDFSNVRIHTEQSASDTAESINAKAFTYGNDIAFASGQYQPTSNEGKRLLGHELTHVIQQQGRKNSGQNDNQIQREIDCKNEEQAKKKQKAIDKTIEDNQERYKGAKTTLFKITDESSWSVAAKKMVEKNKVTSSHELAVELHKLNEGIAFRKGNCIVMLVDWESPKWRSKQKKVDCSERIEKFKKDEAYKQYSDWESELVTDKLKSYESLVAKVKSRKKSLYNGRTNEYTKLVKEINEPWIGKINLGECVAMPVGWKDPNIGSLPESPGKSSELNKAIATVYSEQTNVKLKEQQKYIWYSIRLRVTSSARGADLAAVLNSEYHGIGTPNYKSALKDLAGGKPKIAAVISAKKTVEDNWNNSLPNDAGKFYFHWTRKKSPSLDKYYNDSKRKGDAKEKEAAFRWAKKKGFQGSATITSGWHHIIRGIVTGNDKRYGSMYIYK